MTLIFELKVFVRINSSGLAFLSRGCAVQNKLNDLDFAGNFEQSFIVLFPRHTSCHSKQGWRSYSNFYTLMRLYSIAHNSTQRLSVQNRVKTAPTAYIAFQFRLFNRDNWTIKCGSYCCIATCSLALRSNSLELAHTLILARTCSTARWFAHSRTRHSIKLVLTH